MNNEPPVDYNRPVAYDAEGRPLYAHPPELQQKVVHVARPSEPEKMVVSDSTKIKHDKSKQLYPDLNLSEGEFVISAISRHPIGLLIPFSVGVILITAAFIFIFNYDLISKAFNITTNPLYIILPAILVIIFAIIGTYITYYVYNSNKFYLTNETVIQEIQTSLFSKHEQTVSLSNIEDASFTKIGIIQQFLDYGSIRLSTEGDETTYRFSYVAHPKEHIATLNNAVESFKNGRPVENN